ncbi:MAG: primosomal protein N' [Sedimentisphaerales bacterium]|nr:primosomal protein N' [Sedimentisphaerales bacterium]
MRNISENLFPVEKEQASQANHIIQLAFESAADTAFSYLVPDSLWPVKVGQRIEAPFGRANKPQKGFCVSVDVSKPENIKLKTISKIIDTEPLLNAELMALAQWISEYYVCPLGQVLAAMVPAAVKKGAGVRKERLVYLAVTEDEIFSKIKAKKQKNIIEYLKSKSAFEKDSALKINKVLEKAGCKTSPLNRLAENGIVKITERQILVSLPAVPEGMTLRSEAVVLNDDQQKAMAHFKEQIDSGVFGVTLLYGVTDSGKTELYIRAVEEVIKKGKKAIVLLPEIALTTQTIQRFNDRFENIAVMHSGLTAAQRNVQWQNIKSGKANVVIGARSAIFAPLDNLGLVVVDEEHEPSYKQDTAPRYHGRDVAIKRAQLANAHCILGSATPSLETLFNCKARKHYHLVRLPKRVKDLPMPEMKLVDLRQIHQSSKTVNLISEPLLNNLKNALSKGRQAILFLNRRGYSNFVFCPSCKHMLHCRNCDVTLTFHKSKMPSPSMDTVSGKLMNYGFALCHYCGSQTLVPQKCPLCGKGFAMIGFGSQRLEEELQHKLPAARIARIDSDTMAGKDYYHILKDFSDGKIDILAGTQILAKGLHFPNVTVVGIISAETSLYLPDFRANERTFQLISQVAGRTGRSEKKGTVYVQTFLPDQPAIVFALNNDFDNFVTEELKHRKQCSLPPYWRMANIVLRSTDYEKLELASQNMRQRIDGIIAAYNLQVKVRGPVPALISRIQRFHRMQIIVQAPDAAVIQILFTSLRASAPIKPAVKVAIDIDPVNLL